MAEAMSELEDLEVFGVWRDAMEELHRRGLLSSANGNPVGGYAEFLVARHYGTTPLTGRDQGFDVRRPDTEARVQVKGRRFTTGKTTHWGDFDLFEDRRFDEFIGVLFNEDYSPHSAYSMPRETVDRLATTVRGKRRLRIARVLRAVRDGDETIIGIDLSADR